MLQCAVVSSGQHSLATSLDHSHTVQVTPAQLKGQLKEQSAGALGCLYLSCDCCLVHCRGHYLAIRRTNFLQSCHWSKVAKQPFQTPESHWAHSKNGPAHNPGKATRFSALGHLSTLKYYGLIINEHQIQSEIHSTQIKLGEPKVIKRN